jgi:ATP-dependent Clp protease ATP-binding subunit ClpA
VLAEELAAEPDAETVALYEQIRTGKLDKVTRRQGDKETELATLSPSHHVTQSPNHLIPQSLTPPTTPLLGRDAELTQITALLSHPHYRLVTLVGPPGVGKTRLAQGIYD